MSPGPTAILPVGCAAPPCGSRRVSPENDFRRLDDHAHLVVVLATTAASSVRGGSDFYEPDRALGQGRDLGHSAHEVDVASVANGSARSSNAARREDRSRTVGGIYAIAVDTAKNVALGVAIGAVVLAVLSAVLIKAVVSKLIAIGLLLVIAVAVWSQRTSMDDCADRVRDQLASGSADDTTCSFFGRDVTVPSPR